MTTTKPTKAQVEAGAEAAHRFIRIHGTYPDCSKPKWSSLGGWMRRNRRALARAVLRAAGKEK